MQVSSAPVAGRYDPAVIGSGSAAFAAAIHGVGQGARVVMIERGIVGGTCVNVGCVPSKTLIALADTLKALNRQQGDGVPVKR